MKNVLITGGSGGIGEGTARAFAKENYRICLHYNSNSTVAERMKSELINNGTDCEIFQADLTKENEIKDMFKKIKAYCGGIDVLINNAGMSKIALVSDTTAEDFDKIFSINMKAQFLCVKEALPYMISKQQGSIINISSMWGVNGASCETVYSASKAAIIGFTKALAKELAPSKIAVNCIAPGVIDTKMNASLTKTDIAELIESTPLGRLGKPEDIADTALFLAKSSFITGQTIVCDGGFTL